MTLMTATSHALHSAALAIALLTLSPHTSNAADNVLYETQSEFGPVIVTDEGNGLRAMRFSRYGARQSLVKLGDPEYLGLAYTPFALTGLALCAEPKRFLVLGLGGGSLPTFLRKHYPDAEIDAVDINPTVAAVAKSHFGFREDAHMRVHVMDGRRFIEQVSKPYDAVFLDAFGADALPPHLTTREFLGAVRRAVHNDGIVVGNLWSTAVKPPYEAMVRTYRETFAELHVLQVPGTTNRILIAAPRARQMTSVEFADRAEQLSTAKNFRVNLRRMVELGLLPPEAVQGRGDILTDVSISR
jgi:spermidine synthase